MAVAVGVRSGALREHSKFEIQAASPDFEDIERETGVTLSQATAAGMRGQKKRKG